MRSFKETKKSLSPVFCAALSIPLFASVSQAEVRESSVVKSDTNTVVFYLRAIPQTRDDFPKLHKLIRTFRQYRLDEAKKRNA
jgi:hypothetical protein